MYVYVWRYVQYVEVFIHEEIVLWCVVNGCWAGVAAPSMVFGSVVQGDVLNITMLNPSIV